MEWMDAEKEQLDGQLIRASRLAELGEMATGFAHEINNPLQIMKSEKALVDVLLTELKEKGALPPSSELSELEDSFNQIDLQIDRCARITQSILKFGRQSEPVFQQVDLQTFIPEVTAMVKNKPGVHGITLSQQIDQLTPLVHGDPGQLQQVLLNLYNNAIDAILLKHGVEGGKLVVGAGPREGGKAFIFVQDNGSGIGPADQKKIFSPFFTTKPVGKGTGLGLSVCYGIIGKMGGFMEVESEKGVGTTFTLVLPSSDQSVGAA
jgi:two-component system NtrC family sensor kinase